MNAVADPRPERARVRKKAKRPWRRRVYKALLGYTALSLGAVARWIPAPWAAAFGRAVGRIGSLLAAPDRRLAIANVRAALGERTDDRESRRIAVESFMRLGASAAELVVSHRNPRWILERTTVEGRAHVDEALAAGKGLIWITGHIGNWELMVMKFAELGYPINVVATTIRYPVLNEAMVGFRTRHGVKTIQRGSVSATKDMLRAFRNNEMLGLLIDHDTRVPSVNVEFFGRPARTPVGAAELSLRFGAPVVAGFAVREGRSHRIVVHPPIFPPSGVPRTDAPEVAVRLTAEYTGLIERHIARHPRDWAWMHKRWPDIP